MIFQQPRKKLLLIFQSPSAVVSFLRLRRISQRFTPFLFILLLLLVQSAVRAEDEATWTPIFKGVDYQLIQQTEPLSQMIHLVRIDLQDPDIRFTTTPPNPDASKRHTRCETTLEFVSAQKAQIGINGNFFIYDEKDDTDLLGLAVSDGVVVSPWDKGWAKYAVNIGKDNTVSFFERPEGAENTSRTEPELPLYNVLTGNKMLVLEGKLNAEEEGDRHPRTGVGLTADHKLLLMIADGRQPGHREGLTYHDMAVIFLDALAVNALALDGGGSSTLVLADPEARVVNVPLPTSLPGGIMLNPPGVERKNGNNLAVFAAELAAQRDHN